MICSPIVLNRTNAENRLVWVHWKDHSNKRQILPVQLTWEPSPPRRRGSNIKNPGNLMMVLIYKLQIRSCICDWDGRTDYKKEKKHGKKFWKKLAKYISWQSQAITVLYLYCVLIPWLIGLIYHFSPDPRWGKSRCSHDFFFNLINEGTASQEGHGGGWRVWSELLASNSEG